MMDRRAFVLFPLAIAGCGGASNGLTTPESAETSSTVPPPTVPAPPTVAASEAWRPRYHYTPLRNWMNDPNGLVYFEGEYHLYYQYNPQAAQWGNISWGHASSGDLVTWQEQPVAIAATNRVMAFSGSVVVDLDNTSGLAPVGTASPALLAFFTGFDPHTKVQSQHLASSLDRGRSYQPFAGNPLIDIGSTEFRDPKVFWHALSGHWVMLVVAALQQEVWFYRSTDLKAWTKVSTFGPAGAAANNIWEVPELFELAVDGNPAHKRWVLVVSINHGTLWGGSGVQYFIGAFDGIQFIADPSDTIDALTPPPGDLIADFEGGRLPAGWSVTGTAFGTAPALGALPGQQFVSGQLGRGLMNSFHGGDSSTGTLTSPTFTVTRPYLSFQIAGGRTYLTRLEMRVGDQVVHQASGDDSETLKWKSWDVSALMGQQAALRAVDEATGSWGHISLDSIVMSDAPVVQPDIAHITLWADHGRDFYAPITFANMPDGRVVWLGWMSNWAYAQALPTQPWRGQQSSPRQLDLVTTPRGLRLRQQVVDELLAQVETQPLLSMRSTSVQDASAALASAAVSGRQLLLRLKVSVQGLRGPVGLEVFKGAGDGVRVGYDPGRNTFFVDRSTLTPTFPGLAERHDAARLLDAPEITLEIWIDGSTLELFADGGTLIISDLVYADPSATAVSLFHGPERPTVLELDVHAVLATLHRAAPVANGT